MLLNTLLSSEMRALLMASWLARTPGVWPVAWAASPLRLGRRAASSTRASLALA